MATAGTTTLTTTPAAIFDQDVDGGQPCTTYRVRNRDAAIDAHVNVAGLHPAGQYAVIPPGESELFRRGVDGITKVTAKSASATCVVNHYPVADLT